MSLFDMTANTNVRKLMVLNPEYPKDIETTVIKGNTNSAVFTVEIAEHGKPAEYTYQWYVNDIPVEGATSSTYERTELAETETLSIYCDVTNKKGTVRSRTATLKVTQYYLPILSSSYPEDITVEKGTTVTSKVTIETPGNPDAYTYQWYKDGVAVSDATTDTFVYTPAEVGKTTVYCEVTNVAGTVTSRTSTISAIYTIVPGTFFDSLADNSGNSRVYRNSDGSWTFTDQNGCNFKKAINVTNFTKMRIAAWKGKFHGTTFIGLFDGSINNASLIAGYTRSTHDSESFDRTYDISKITGNVYFGIRAKYDAGQDVQQFYATISRVVFE